MKNVMDLQVWRDESQMPMCLEKLYADECVKLKRIRGLEQATKLSVTGCSELEELPRKEALVCLEELWANDCVKLKRIRGLEQATKLRLLPSTESLASLQELWAGGCVKLKGFGRLC
uniref:Uncharacterized protein n=1 Tax=Picea sitchensis TaxID=3332 RepID=A9NVL3_PICSI|nr:unknown [Picea sitchensis]